MLRRLLVLDALVVSLALVVTGAVGPADPGAGSRNDRAVVHAAAASAPVTGTTRGHDPVVRHPHGVLSFLHVGAVGSDGLHQIVDRSGRSVLLRGVNVDGLVDYYRRDLRPPYPSRPAAYRHGRCPPDDRSVEGVPFCGYDAGQMRSLGYDTIRLNVSWSLLEPRPGVVSRQYVRRIAQAVSWARRQRIWVVIDLHQDAYSKYVFTPRGTSCPPPLGATRGFDGAPRWATTHAAPACTVDGTRELDLAVQEAAQRFWTDAQAPDGVGLQEHYARVVTVLARRFAHDPAVAGYDVMNEPEPGFAPQADAAAELLPFYAKVADTLQRRVTGFRQLLFVEPAVERNTTAQRAFFTPWSAVSSYPNVVYAPHVYTKVFTAGAVTGTPDTTTFGSDYDAAQRDAKALGLPLWVGEFGGPPAKDATILARHYSQQETRRIGGTMWLWKENANDSIRNTFWGVYGPPFRGAHRRGVPQPERVRRTSRVYPLLTEGRLLAARSRPMRGTAVLRAVAARVRSGDRRHATLVAVPAVFRGRLVVKGARHRVVRRGHGRWVWLYPNGGRYSLRVR